MRSKLSVKRSTDSWTRKTARLSPIRILVTSRGSAVTAPPARVRGCEADGAWPVPEPAQDALGALEAHGGTDHALGADGALAAGTAHAGFTIRMPVAGGQGLGVLMSLVLRALRVAWRLVHGVPSIRSYAMHRPAHPYGWAGR